MGESEAISDFAPKKLARQLDFTAICRASANVVLSQHSKFQSSPPSHPQLHQQAPPKQAQPVVQLQARPQQVAVVRRIRHPVEKLTLQMFQPAKQESPGTQPGNNVEAKDGTPRKGRKCNCKNSRCLKLYCECFAAGIHCNGCNCLYCFNNVENEAARQEAVGATLERNPNAFRSKIASSPQGSLDTREDASEAKMIGKHNKGCHCKKSGCLKKYCECFQANILCSENCKCLDCKNFEGSGERRALFHGNHNGVAYMQQAANVAISGAIGSSGYGSPHASRKRKSEEHLGSVTRDQCVHNTGKFQQENYLRNSAASLSPLSAHVSCAANATFMGSSKFTYKSTLADILQPRDMKVICSLLVVLSQEVIKALSGKGDRQLERGNNHKFETAAASFIQGKEDSLKGHDVHKTLPDDRVNGNSAERDANNDSGTDGGNLNDGRPPSPEIDLMCHEQEMTFIEAASPTGATGYCQNKNQITSSRHECSAIYAEQEKLILIRFRDFLNRLITCGSIKEAICSPSNKSKTGNQQEPSQRNIIDAGAETGNNEKA